MKASILTSCYNCAPWLSACIRSVKSQKYQEWEWIIVEDKSTDKSWAILKKAAARCVKIKVIRNKDRLKCGGSYSRALEEATGDICCVLDADDVLASPVSLTKLVNLYRTYPDVSYIWTQFGLCDPYMKMIKPGSCRLPKTSFLQAGVDYTKDRHAFSHWRTFRTHLRDKDAVIFKPGLPAAVDKWMGYTLEELGTGGFFNEILYLYRQRVGGLSFKGRKHWKRMLQTFSEHRKTNNIQPYPTVQIKERK